jgi:hypothetical protein
MEPPVFDGQNCDGQRSKQPCILCVITQLLMSRAVPWALAMARLVSVDRCAESVFFLHHNVSNVVTHHNLSG